MVHRETLRRELESLKEGNFVKVMVKILKQFRHIKEGNDCQISDEIVMISVHERYVCEIIRRYSGWADNGLDFRDRKEFGDYYKALAYYTELVDKTNI